MNQEDKLLNFKKLLYPNNTEVEELNEKQTKKVIYETLREVLKHKKYQFTIGSYYFDVTPKNLSVIYQTPDTRLEVSNTDIHFETTRQTPARIFVVSDKEMDEYPEDIPYITVVGEILSYDNFLNTEMYSITLGTPNDKDTINNYLNIPEEFEIHVDDYLNDDKQIAVSRDINKKDIRTDVSIFFDKNKVKPVEFDYQNRKFISKKFEETEDYSLLIPNVDKKKKIISTIYSTIISYYNEYINR